MLGHKLERQPYGDGEGQAGWALSADSPGASSHQGVIRHDVQLQELGAAMGLPPVLRRGSMTLSGRLWLEALTTNPDPWKAPS